MTRVVFFEKPGCRNNTRQKALLATAGHEVIARDLRTEPWTPERLRPFFGARPVTEWFNPTAAPIKSGEIDPEHQTEDSALALMVDNPMLIRRPLMEANGDHRCGFDMESVDAWIGLATEDRGDVETCPKSHLEEPEPCPEPYLEPCPEPCPEPR